MNPPTVTAPDEPGIDAPDGPAVPDGPPSPRRSGRRIGRVLAVVAAAVAVLVVAAVAVFLLGRSQPRQLDASEAVAQFRRAGGAATTSEGPAGRPPAGVYPATAVGTESVGLPGLDEPLGPAAPVTVTHGDGGCFTYRVDFNDHHWRSWTFCPTATAAFGLVGADSWTKRKAPGLDLESLSTYACDPPLDLWWSAVAAGQSRTGACSSVSELDGAVVRDDAAVRVVGRGTVEVDGERVEVVRLRTTERFSGGQTGTEVDDWWVDATTFLPVRLRIDSDISSEAGTYAETADLRLTSLTPAS